MKVQRFAGNFKPIFWSEKVQKELEKALIIANWCNYDFDGEINYKERVKIIGVVRPSVVDYVKGQDLTFEELADNAQYLDIDHADAFGFKVFDFDKAQSNPKYLTAEMSEAAQALAEKEDATIAKEAFEQSLTAMRSSSTDISAETDPFDVIDAGIVKLYKNNVPATTELAADLNPEHIMLLKKKLASLFTDNVDYIKNSAVGKYNNCYLRMTNNLYNNGTDDMELIRTKKAVAVAGQINKIEHTDMENDFGTKIKGLNTYGVKVVRPKELYIVKVH